MILLTKKYLLCLLFITHIISSNMPQGGFLPFVQKYFVETGTYCGDGIQQALNAGFSEIRSVELNPRYTANAKTRFKRNRNVRIYQGNSGDILYDVIKEINEPITFWLDGHNEMYNPHAENCPILRELDQIKKHHIKTHIILIDDMHCAGKHYFDFITQEMIIQKIKEINPNYTISYVAGGDESEYPNNIMIAQVLN